jgi:hypothetical protein
MEPAILSEGAAGPVAAGRPVQYGPVDKSVGKNAANRSRKGFAGFDFKA